MNICACCFAAPALAGSFAVTPVRIFMTPKDKAVAVTITNESDEELVMQADVYSWMQKPNGEDDLVLTEDLLLSPPIIKVPAKSHQVVRLARLHQLAESQQITYRMFIREIPEAKPVKNKVSLQFAIAFSMPIFITPSGAKNKLDCNVERTGANSVAAICENTGSAYAQPTSFVLNNIAGDVVASQSKGGYILPNIKRSFDIKSDTRIPGGKAVLSVKLDEGAVQKYDVLLAE